MRTSPRSPHAAARIALLAAIAASGASMADTPANAGMRFVDFSAQADDQHDLQAVTTLSLPVGEHAWVQASGGKSRSEQATGPRRPDILGLVVGAAGPAWQFTLGATQRADANRFRQADWASALDWRHQGDILGLDLTHRRSLASGTVDITGALGASTAVPAQARIAGTGVGLHGTLAATEHLGVYAAVARNHYTSSTQQAAATTGGPLASNPLLASALLGGASVVDRDEVALDRSALVGASWRWSRTALSAEYATGRVHDNGGTLRSVAVKAAVDVAPGWRVTPGVGRGTSDQGGQATFASLSVTYGW